MRGLADGDRARRAAGLRKVAFDLRAAAIACFSALSLFLAIPAEAAGTWWEQIQGFGVPDYGYDKNKTEPRTERPDKPNDLRPNSTPWRSEFMLDAMDEALERYQRLADKGGWPTIPPGRIMRPGDDDERVPRLRQRLRATGELKSRKDSFYGESYEYGADVEDAVRRFQESHGLRISGRVDQTTLIELNVPVDERLAQLTLNRDRIRNLVQQPVEDRYVLVNIAAYQLEAVEHRDVEERHRVIVGRQGRETPELKANIRALNFYPYWKVPDSVAQLDLIPKLMKEPEYLQTEQIRVVTGDFNGHEIDPRDVDWSTASAAKIKFRQDPGPQNALGLLRLDMSNEHGVYMHDTPLKKLFDQRQRAFSAGCVRVQDVFQLGEWVVRNEPGWEQPGRVQETLAAGQPLDVELTHPVPVYFTYITAWAEPDGSLQFRPDIYGRDGRRTETAGAWRDPDEPPPPPPSLAP